MRRRVAVLGEMLALSIRADRRIAALVGVLVVANTVAVAATAVTQRWIVDATGTGDSATSRILLAASLGGLALAVTRVVDLVQISLRDDLSDRVEVRLNTEILATTAAIPTIAHLERPDHLDRLAMLRAGGASGTRALAVSCWATVETCAAVLSLGFTVFLLGGVHPGLAALAVLGGAPLLLGNRGDRVVWRALDATAGLARHEQALHDLCVQPGPGKEVRLAGNGNELSRRARDLWGTATRREVSARLRGGGWQLAGWAMFVAGFAVAIAVTAEMVRSGRATVGDIVLVVMLASRLSDQIGVALSGFVRIAEAGRITDHYLWLRDYAAAQSYDGGPAPTLLTDGIALDGVSFRYPGTDAPALDGVTLRLPAGSVVGLVGLNGAGKSTLVKLLTGLYRPERGSITVDGQDLVAFDPASWSARVTGAFQDFAKPSLQAGEAIGIGNLDQLDDRSAIGAATDRAGAADVIATLSNGFETQLGREFDGVELSHGQWQKLALARALMRPTALLRVMDEPTAALDPEAEHNLFEHIAEQARSNTGAGAITVLVSHRFSTLHMADHIVVLAGGRVVEQGSHADLLAAGGEYAALYTTQSRSYQ